MLGWCFTEWINVFKHLCICFCPGWVLNLVLFQQCRWLGTWGPYLAGHMYLMSKLETTFWVNPAPRPVVLHLTSSSCPHLTSEWFRHLFLICLLNSHQSLPPCSWLACLSGTRFSMLQKAWTNWIQSNSHRETIPSWLFLHVGTKMSWD